MSAIHWFRKGLRLHDNPALVHAIKNAEELYPVFILDPWFAKPEFVGVNRYNFLLEALSDLDSELRKLNSRLFVVRGKPAEVLAPVRGAVYRHRAPSKPSPPSAAHRPRECRQVMPVLFKRWGVGLLTFERDTEPYAQKRDSAMTALGLKYGVKVISVTSHTLYKPEDVLRQQGGKAPKTYRSFCSALSKLGPPPQPLPAPTTVAPPPAAALRDGQYDVPTLVGMGYPPLPSPNPCPFRGGETEARTSPYSRQLPPTSSEPTPSVSLRNCLLSIYLPAPSRVAAHSWAATVAALIPGRHLLACGRSSRTTAGSRSSRSRRHRPTPSPPPRPC